MKAAFVIFGPSQNIGAQLRLLASAAFASGYTPADCMLWVAGSRNVFDYQWPSFPEIVFSGGVPSMDSHPKIISAWLELLARKHAPDLILMRGGACADTAAAMLATALSGHADTGILSVQRVVGGLRTERACFGQNLHSTQTISKALTILTIAPNAALSTAELPTEGCPSVSEYLLPSEALEGGPILLGSAEASKNSGLADAHILVIAGRGIGSRECLSLLQSFANSIGAQWGVTRPLFMDGWAGHDRLVGISGAITRPEIALLFGVSGAAAFIAGIQSAKRIIAVNTDPNAQIFRSADYGLVADCHAVLEKLVAVVGLIGKGS